MTHPTRRSTWWKAVAVGLTAVAVGASVLAPATASAHARPDTQDRLPAAANSPATKKSTGTTKKHGASTSSRFVTAKGDKLMLGNKVFEFSGTNTYYLGYKSDAMVDAALDDAADAGLIVMRTWGFQDYQNPDGSGSVHQNFEGVWYQAWDEEAGAPVVNTGADGLERLDYVVAAAAERGIRLVIPFTNNWNAFGGMDQYVRWAGEDTHADFYTDAQIKGWFKDWISTLMNRTNSLTGVKYKDDPTIMAWELANEPRCTSAGAYPDGDCDTSTITAWADEMSTYVKSVGRKQLLSVGDEGFFCRGESRWTLTQRYGESGYGAGFGEDCADGVDTVALASLKNIDMMSMHLYPDHWKTSVEWGTGWITEHAAAAKKIGKPVYLGEFGFLDKSTRMPVYNTWLKAVRDTGVDGALYWILASEQDDGTLYADYDGFTVYCPSPVCSLMTLQGQLVSGKNTSSLLRTTLADDDTLLVERDTTATIDVSANDISLSGTVNVRTVDLDIARKGRQTTVSKDGGALSIVKGGTVSFVPAEGFVGTVAFPYSIGNGRTTSTATLTVTVRPAAGDPVVLASWEDGLEGWTAANWQSDAGALTTGPSGATDGDSALQVASKGAWFGSPADDPTLDLSARRSIEFDLTTGDVGTSVSVAVRYGDAWTWCQSPWHWVPENTSETVTVGLETFGCATADLAEVHDVLVYFGAGSYSVDRLTLS
ncbi:cellulase family glycosylhydrolase [Tessaracoccus lacteus]|uniref:mannan endo-1,4-beta-mannosidase n=1 Tax=Tessaracoccus lacteus TaxID=3041766 RepID=A0ABY8PX60_9ACTN|nr:cellulase family glycosylhydrolase [Tessaracoccus sp. T21]WGT47080.1 cellulase family glycosylhydrolase [Tessaracoccus sp. T21]